MKKRFAIIVNGKAANIAVSKKSMGDNWVESDIASKGDAYNSATGVFTKPPGKPPEVPQKSPLQELVDILKDNDTITEEQATGLNP